MAVVISDTSPLNYLVLIDAVELLPRLFTKVFIPQAVREELSHDKTPQKVRAWLDAKPGWLEIKTAAASRIFPQLDKGETEAISLAKELHISFLLIDDREGFKIAVAEGLQPIGLLGILEQCAALGWIDFDEYIKRLRQTSFRFHEQLIANARLRLGE